MTLYDTLPGLSTGVMNHVDKDSRPDLLKGSYVKVEPGGERNTQKGSLKLAHLERGETDEGTSEIWGGSVKLLQSLFIQVWTVSLCP